MRYLLLILLTFTAPVARAQLLFSFDDRTVTIAGLEVGESVVLLGVGREQVLDGPYTRRSLVTEILEDADADGEVSLATDRAVPRLSMWAAVSLSSGESTVAAGPGHRLNLIDEATDVRTVSDSGRVQIDREVLELLAVRPGVGAWRLRVRDGQATDTDRAYDRTVDISFADFETQTDETDVPASFQPGDVLIAIDPEHLAILQYEFGSES